MRPIATDRVKWSVGHDHELCNNGWTDRDAVWDENSGGPKEPCIRWKSRNPHVNGQFWGQKKGWLRKCLNMSGSWYTQSDSTEGSTGMVWMSMGCTRWGAHWRHLVNMTEPSICGSDAALCQVTLTTCYGMVLSKYGCKIIHVNGL